MIKSFQPLRWLWWLALLILAAGAGLLYLMYRINPEPQPITDQMRMVAMCTVVSAGICIISATARWWIHR